MTIQKLSEKHRPRVYFWYAKDNSIEVHYLPNDIEDITNSHNKKDEGDLVDVSAYIEEFNADFYVPPQIYYSYSYLMKWYGGGKYGREPETILTKNLYTLFEPDGEHPQFLQAWLERQDTIGKIIKNDYSWGDITVQKRERIYYGD